MSAADQLPGAMTVVEFLAWNPRDSDQWQLIDGTARDGPGRAATRGYPERSRPADRQSPAELRPHWRVVTEPGIQPKVRANLNIRVPDLAVTCASWQPDDRLLHEPLVVIEILSPSNEAETWGNVWSHVTIPSVREILVLHTAEIRADLLRRDEDGAWPDNPLTLTTGDAVTLQSIDFTAPITAFYRTA